jgi:hypothetical protein
MGKQKNIKPAALVGAGLVTGAVVLSWITFGLFEKKIHKECTPCATKWIAYIAEEGTHFRKVDKQIIRYRYRKNNRGEKVCMVWGSDHVWYELLPGRPVLESTSDTTIRMDVIDPDYPTAYCDWK